MATPGSLITTRAHLIDTYVDEYPRGWQNKLIVPRYEDLPGQIDGVIVQIYQRGYWTDFPAVWEPLASPAPARGVYVYQVNDSWERQAVGALERLPPDCQSIWLDIEKGGNTLDRTFIADSGRILDLWRAERPHLLIGYYANSDVYMNYILRTIAKNYPGMRWHLDYPLWVAQWPWATWLRTPFNNPSLPAGMRGDWTLFQYSDVISKAAFGSTDGDVFNGTVEAMLSAFGATEPAPPTQPMPPPIVVNPTPGSTPVGAVPILGGVGSMWTMQHQGATCHVIRLLRSMVDVEFDDGVSVSVTTSYLKRRKVQVAINGLDGWSTVRRGRAAITSLKGGMVINNGRQFGRLSGEQALYFTRNGAASLDRPVLPWAACGFPNLLVKGGVVQPINKDPAERRARTAFGVDVDQTVYYLVAVDGGDYNVRVGLSVQQTADLMVALGCDLAVLADSGGSTTMAIEGPGGEPRLVNTPSGEIASAGNQRAVAVHMGFRLRR